MEKKMFVEGTLSETVVAACDWVKGLELIDDETADIVCKNGYRYHVCIACDSKAAIVCDVMKEILNH